MGLRMQEGNTGIFTLASITDSSLPRRLRSGRRGVGGGESIHAEASLKPGRVQGSLSPLEKRMYSPLCFGSGALSLWGHDSCNSLQRPPCPTRTRAGRPLQQEGSFQPPSEGSVLQQKEDSRLLDPLVFSLLLLLWCEWSSREPQEMGSVPTTHHTLPGTGCFPSLGTWRGGGRGVPRPPSWGACWCGQCWCAHGKPKDTHLRIYFSPSHVILFLDWTRELFGGWPAAR